MATDLTPEGWYPDPSGGTRLRWWDGEDWSDHYRTRPLETFGLSAPDVAAPARAAQAAAGGLGPREVDRIVGAVQDTTRTEMNRAVGELQQAARGEVDRVVGEVRRQVGNVTPLITDTVGQVTRYIRWAAIIGFLLVVAYFVFQVVAGIGIAELVTDVADRIIDAVNDDDSLGVPLTR
ncbi:MAG: DUF2510 domain-containing protein [Actinomycetota bacterium]